MTRVFNHVGHCVTDLDASVRFYTELLGFEAVMTLQPPDGPTGQILQLDRPALEAVYLRLGDFVLELLHFGIGAGPNPRRVMNEAGLTHLSINVDADELASLVERCPALGGTVLADTDLGGAIMLVDPDGLRVELTTGWRRPG